MTTKHNLDLCRRIRVLVDRADKGQTKVDEYIIAAAQHLKELKSSCSTQEFLDLAREHCGLRKSRAYELLAIGNGKKTIEDIRKKEAAKHKRLRAAKSCPVRTGQPEPEPSSSRAIAVVAQDDEADQDGDEADDAIPQLTDVERSALGAYAFIRSLDADSRAGFLEPLQAEGLVPSAPPPKAKVAEAEIGPSSPSEIARKLRRLEELEVENARLGRENIALRSEVEELREALAAAKNGATVAGKATVVAKTEPAANSTTAEPKPVAVKTEPTTVEPKTKPFELKGAMAARNGVPDATVADKAIAIEIATIDIVIAETERRCGSYSVTLADGTPLLASSRRPERDGARELLKRGADPKAPIVVRRSTGTIVTSTTVGKAAKLAAGDGAEDQATRPLEALAG